MAEKDFGLDRLQFGLIDVGVTELCATVAPPRGPSCLRVNRRSEGERRKKPAAAVGMTPGSVAVTALRINGSSDPPNPKGFLQGLKPDWKKLLMSGVEGPTS